MDNKMIRKFSFFAAGFVILAGLGLTMNACYYDNEQELYTFVQTSTCDTTTITYATVSAIMINNNCNGCHSASNPNSNVITDNYNDLKASAVAGKLLRSVDWTGSKKMPQGGNKLTDCEITKIRLWIARNYPN